MVIVSRVTRQVCRRLGARHDDSSQETVLPAYEIPSNEPGESHGILMPGWVNRIAAKTSCPILGSRLP